MISSIDEEKTDKKSDIKIMIGKSISKNTI